MDEETWTIEVTPARFGWHAVATSGNWRLGGTIDGFGGMPVWRPTRSWAQWSIERIVRRYFRERTKREERAARAHVYRFQR